MNLDKARFGVREFIAVKQTDFYFGFIAATIENCIKPAIVNFASLKKFQAGIYHFRVVHFRIRNDISFFQVVDT